MMMAELETAKDDDALKDKIKSEYKGKIRDIERRTSVARSKEVVQQFEAANPDFRKTADDIAVFNRNLNQFRVDTGLLSQETADMLNKKYPHYIPTYRVGEASLGTGSLRGKYNFEVKQSVKTAKGSDKIVDNPILNYIHQTVATYKQGRVNNLMKLLHDNADGMYVVTKDDGKKTEQKNPDDEAGVLDYEKSIDKTNHELTYYDNGKKVTMKVHHNIFSGFEGFTSASTNTFSFPVAKGLIKINDIFKAAVTTWNPFFAPTNLLRDTGDALFYSKFGAVKWSAARIRAQKEIHSNSSLWQEYLAMGGLQSSIYDYDNGFVGNLNGYGLLKKAKATANIQQKVTNITVASASTATAAQALHSRRERRLRGNAASAGRDRRQGSAGRYSPSTEEHQQAFPTVRSKLLPEASFRILSLTLNRRKKAEFAAWKAEQEKLDAEKVKENQEACFFRGVCLMCLCIFSAVHQIFFIFFSYGIAL